MRCGHCKGEHDTVAEVRECSTKDQPDVDAIPEGYYAVDSLTGNNDTDFFRVDKPVKGQWAGHTFVKQIVGGEQYFQQRGARKWDALRAIAAVGPKIAGERFAAEMEKCYKCFSPLTKYASRSLGLGRTCAGHKGVGDLWDRIQKEWEDAQHEDERQVAEAEPLPDPMRIHPKPIKVKTSRKARPLARKVGNKEWPDIPTDSVGN